MDQGSTMKRSAVQNFAPTVTKLCVMWEGQALPHDTKFGNSRCEIVGRRVIFIWSLIHGLRWSGLIKAEPGLEPRSRHIWRLCCQKQVSQAGISNYIPQFTVGCNYISLTEIPASGNKVLICEWIASLISIIGARNPLNNCSHWTSRTAQTN